MPFFDRSPPDCLQRLQFAFVLFKSRSCLFQELSVPCGSIALAGSYRYVNHPKTGFFGLAIFNLRCSFNFAFGSIPYRWNVLILTFSVLMQSNPTCFFFFFRLLWGLQPLPLSSVGHLRQSGSRTSQFMLEVCQRILVIHERKEYSFWWLYSLSYLKLLITGLNDRIERGG